MTTITIDDATVTRRHFVYPRASTTTTDNVVIKGFKGTRPTGAGGSKDLESAVYGYLRAVRALGRTRVTPSEISRAMGLPRVVVEQALAALSKRGVKLAK